MFIHVFETHFEHDHSWKYFDTKLVLNDDVSIIYDVIHHVTGTQLHVFDWTNGILVKFYKFLSQPHDVNILFWVPVWSIINHYLLILSWYLPKPASGRMSSWDTESIYVFGGIMAKGANESSEQWILSNLKFTGNFGFHLTYKIIQNCIRNGIFE